jgi:hypothetical protein
MGNAGILCRHRPRREPLHHAGQQRAVAGIFPGREAVLRLFSAPLAEQTAEWLVGRHYFSETSLRAVLHDAPSPREEVAVA